MVVRQRWIRAVDDGVFGSGFNNKLMLMRRRFCLFVRVKLRIIKEVREEVGVCVGVGVGVRGRATMPRGFRDNRAVTGDFLEDEWKSEKREDEGRGGAVERLNLKGRGVGCLGVQGLQ